MADNRRLAGFDQFIQSARAFCAANPETEARMMKIKLLLSTVVDDASLRGHSKTSPCPEGHKILLLSERIPIALSDRAAVGLAAKDGRPAGKD